MMILLLLPAALLCPSRLRASEPDRDSLLVVFWNVENFFDYRSENKPPHWTRRRFYVKCEGIAKTLLLIADRYGRVPDAVGLAEVENAFVVRQLTSSTALRKLGYRVVHYDSPDHRGIDCALLCREATLPLRESAPKHVPDSAGGILPTRDILLAEFDSLAILVNHHPSQIGGKDDRRQLARARLRSLTDSLHAAGVRRTLAIGDFNEDLWGEIRRSEPANDGERSRDLPHSSQRGTIKYNGKWEKIDGCPVLEGLTAEESVFCPPHLSEPDRGYAGTKPRRTYSGPRYKGGLSDHYPVVYRIKISD